LMLGGMYESTLLRDTHSSCSIQWSNTPCKISSG
jgi:hypothetical protein